MIPLTTLYDEYIDRSKLTEQKKTQFVYSSPPPLKRGRNNYFIRSHRYLETLQPNCNDANINLILTYLSNLRIECYKIVEPLLEVID